MGIKIVITGTSRGLGRALSDRLVTLGHQVFGGARTPFQKLDREPAASYVELDVSREDSQRAWWDQAETSLGALPDLVVANAGLINRSAPLWEVPEEEFRRVLEVNLVGVFLTFQQFLTRRRQQGNGNPAVLVALSSGWGRSTSPEVAPYCASKWGIEGMVKSLAQELPPELSVIALNPGIIDTEMLRSCFGSEASHYSKPETWAVAAAEQILGLSRKDNGSSRTVV